MDEPKDSKHTEPIAAQAGELLAELLKGVGSHLERQSKFEVAYANNFHFEPSVWDLKIIFGQLEQHTGTSAIDWHTAITVPWIQVKFIAYFLRVQAAWYELQTGAVKTPPSLMPKRPQPPTADAASDPTAMAWYEANEKIYAEMFG